MQRAFDSVDHNLNLAVFKSYGFGADFIQWIKLI